MDTTRELLLDASRVRQKWLLVRLIFFVCAAMLSRDKAESSIFCLNNDKIQSSHRNSTKKTENWAFLMFPYAMGWDEPLF